MTQPRLQNYLRTYRRRNGLSETEVAALLGAASGTKVSRYENFARMPGVVTVFAFEIVFNQPASELFAGEYHAIRLMVRDRARRMIKRLDGSPGAQDASIRRKIALLRSIVEK